MLALLLLVGACVVQRRGGYTMEPEGSVTVAVINESGGPVAVYWRSAWGGKMKLGTATAGAECIDTRDRVHGAGWFGLRHLSQGVVWAHQQRVIDAQKGWILTVTSPRMARHDLVDMLPAARCTVRGFSALLSDPVGSGWSSAPSRRAR